MKKLLIALWIISLVLVSCNTTTTVKGFYQSKDIDGYVVQISIYKDSNEFTEYIDNREVNKGTYQDEGKGTYLMLGNNEVFTIDVNNEDSFHRTIKGMKDGEPIKMKNKDDVPVSFSTVFGDEDEYERLLEE